MTNTEVSKPELKPELKKELNSAIAVGVVLILLGVGAIAFPSFSTLAAEIWIAWIITFSGISKLVYAVQTRQEEGFIWKLLLGILYAATGLFLLVYPLEGELTLTLVLGVFLFMEGVFETIFAFRLRPQPNWIWVLGNGITTLILGGLIWFEWPLNGSFAIGLLVGISILFSGVTRILLSTAARSTLKQD